MTLIDYEQEHLITLAEAALLVPKRRGKTVHISSMYRWTTRGCRGVLLEFTQVGATRMTSREALARFFARLANQEANQNAEDARLHAAEELGIAQAEAELDEEGV